MKTGEILLYISKKDLQTLFNNYIQKEYNKLCPFADILTESIEIEADIPAIESLLKNNYIVYLISNLAKPDSLLQLRVGGPGFKYNKLSVCKTRENTYILVIFDGDFYGIQYYEDNNTLSNVISAFIIDSDGDEESELIPKSLNYESFVLYLSIIDSYRYINYRNSLNHDNTTLLKITTEEFNKVLTDSVKKFDARWVLSNLMYFLPSVSRFNIKGEGRFYDELFEQGYLISVKDKNTNEGSVLLGIKSIDLGAEFLELWYKSAGIQVSFIKDAEVETVPLAFLAVTGNSNHCFMFEENSDNLNYKNINSDFSMEVFSGFINKLTKNSVTVNNNDESNNTVIKPKFCGKCGAKVIAGANFCNRCGTKIK